MNTSSAVATKVADEAWIAAARLQRDHPARSDFSVEEIVACARQLGFHRPGVYVHVLQHDVANRPPNPGRYRMLLETAPGRRRLFRPGDPFDARRDGAKVAPAIGDLPAAHRQLRRWYDDWSRQPPHEPGGLLAMIGSGRHLWADEHADAYIERLRSDWP